LERENGWQKESFVFPKASRFLNFVRLETNKVIFLMGVRKKFGLSFKADEIITELKGHLD
jgi:hypothetical protein